MSQAASITVAVRVRPPTEWEAERLPELDLRDRFMGDGHLTTAPRPVVSASCLRPVVRVMDQRLLIFDPKDEFQERAFQQKGFLPPGTKRYKDKRYMFDRVFDEATRQEDVFEATTRPLLEGLLDGFNATVFAYGATGCGKTHTISGTDSDPGIIYLTMAELFQRIDDKREDMNIEVSVTFLEIYNEEIRDLLIPVPAKGSLAIREDKSNRIVVPNLTELQPTSAEEVKHIVLAGNSRRTQSPTHANATSSRSHAVLQINITQSPRTANTSEQRTMATLSIIDLAGSERASATKNMGERMQEGANINKSLLALGNCINALCESGGRTRHVPYRNSKLTRLLKFSLGGNCKTVMIVCIAPTSNHYEDTGNTLNYADRAKQIKTKVSRNYVSVDRHVGQYVEAINRLNDEVAELKAKLAGKAGAEAEVTKRRKADAKTEAERAKSDVQTKVDQTRPIIVAGAACQGDVTAAQTKLSSIRLRITELDSQGDLPSDLAAERGLLQSLADEAEAVVRAKAPLVMKAGNSNSMFDALLRAVTERRSDKLDELTIDNVRLDARFQRAEMDKLRAEAERDSMKAELDRQTRLVAGLVGMLARSNAMIAGAGSRLQSASDSADLSQLSSVTSSLKTLTTFNDATFTSLVGAATASFSSNIPSSLTSLTVPVAVPTAAPALVPVPVPVLMPIPAPKPVVRSRRTPSVGGRAASLGGSPARRMYPTPRKQSALRQSLSSRGVQSKPASARVSTEKKSLRWKDEAGAGSLDDSRPPADVPKLTSNAKPVVGSESEWEDEPEKTDDSSSSVSVQLRVPPVPLGVAGPSRRPRSKKLDPGYLQPRLGSVVEDEEARRSPVLERKVVPLTDRVNQLGITSSNDSSDDLFLNKPCSPVRDVPTSASKARRRSNLGPARNDRPRRRSSLIPVPSPPVAAGRPRQERKSSARRARRPSPTEKMSIRPLSLPGLSAPEPSGGRPTWK